MTSIYRAEVMKISTRCKPFFHLFQATEHPLLLQYDCYRGDLESGHWSIPARRGFVALHPPISIQICELLENQQHTSCEEIDWGSSIVMYISIKDLICESVTRLRETGYSTVFPVRYGPK